LPHFDAGELPQTITFRLAGSIPSVLLRQWRAEAKLAAVTGRSVTADERVRVEQYLNRGVGPTWLADPQVASPVENALHFFDGTRYRLHAWVIMPNHVSGIVSSWKSYTAKRANTLLGRQGAFWQEDYFDRFIRDERHFAAAIHYVEENPVVAGRCAAPEDWGFSSARHRQAQS
jgi:putative DNA methylase